MAGFTYEDDRGYITEERKRWVVRLNDAIRPWIRLLARISDEPHLKKLDYMTQDRTLGPEDGVPVYVRMCLEGEGEYIGYTEHWENRVKKHYKATCEHRTGHKGCRKCHEHTRYIRHRTALPHAWISFVRDCWIPVSVLVP